MKTNAKIQSIRKIAGNKFSVAFTQVVQMPGSKINLLALANAGDERFDKNQSKPRFAWMSFTKDGLMNVLGIDADKLNFSKNDKGHEIAILNMDAPTVAGKELNIQIKETVGPYVKKDKTFDAINNRKKVNVEDENGVITANYVTKNGALVYSYATVEVGEPNHVKVEDTTLIPCEEYDFAQALASEADDNIA